jgi:uncharacterized membrane protein YdbT with pleckstrin-like domain
MSYWKSNLLSGESVLFEGGVHWAIYLSGLSTALVGFALGFWLGLPSGIYVLAGFGLVACYFAVPAWIRSHFTEILVTNQRVMIKVGVFRRQMAELNLEHLESFEVDQTVVGRLFNYGDLRAIGTGGTTLEIDFVAEPLTIRKMALEAHARCSIKN